MQIDSTATNQAGEQVQVRKSYEQRQEEVTRELGKVERTILAHQDEIKALKDSKKALQEFQRNLWEEKHGPQYTIWDILDKEESE